VGHDCNRLEKARAHSLSATTAARPKIPDQASHPWLGILGPTRIGSGGVRLSDLLSKVGPHLVRVTTLENLFSSPEICRIICPGSFFPSTLHELTLSMSSWISSPKDVDSVEDACGLLSNLKRPYLLILDFDYRGDGAAAKHSALSGCVARVMDLAGDQPPGRPFADPAILSF